MNTKNLTDLSPATLAALAKTAADAADATRSELSVGTHQVDTIITLVLGAEVKVLADQEDVLTPQKAKPWNLVQALLIEINQMREAAGMVGIDLAKVVALAETMDKDLVSKIQKEADTIMSSLKEPTRGSRKGAVKVKGEAKLPAV